MLRMTRAICILLAFASVLVTSTAAYAQFDTATVIGTVKDNTGAVVPGATVILTESRYGDIHHAGVR